jgi:hypothetical protein
MTNAAIQVFIWKTSVGKQEGSFANHFWSVAVRIRHDSVKYLSITYNCGDSIFWHVRFFEKRLWHDDPWNLGRE